MNNIQPMSTHLDSATFSPLCSLSLSGGFFPPFLSRSPLLLLRQTQDSRAWKSPGLKEPSTPSPIDKEFPLTSLFIISAHQRVRRGYNDCRICIVYAARAWPFRSACHAASTLFSRFYRASLLRYRGELRWMMGGGGGHIIGTDRARNYIIIIIIITNRYINIQLTVEFCACLLELFNFWI